jgi:ssRNA-specific RNase YbeY (16S rRNA maturation enzyme)
MDHADDAEAAAMQAREREHLARRGSEAGSPP